MKRKRRNLVAIICALTLALFNAVPVSACTPPLNPPSVKIPDINFEPDDALEEAFDNAVKKCVSQKPMERGKNTIRPIQHFTALITLMILMLMEWTELQWK